MAGRGERKVGVFFVVTITAGSGPPDSGAARVPRSAAGTPLLGAPHPLALTRAPWAPSSRRPSAWGSRPASISSKPPGDRCVGRTQGRVTVSLLKHK